MDAKFQQSAYDLSDTGDTVTLFSTQRADKYVNEKTDSEINCVHRRFNPRIPSKEGMKQSDNKLR